MTKVKKTKFFQYRTTPEGLDMLKKYKFSKILDILTNDENKIKELLKIL